LTADKNLRFTAKLANRLRRLANNLDAVQEAPTSVTDGGVASAEAQKEDLESAQLPFHDSIVRRLDSLEAAFGPEGESDLKVNYVSASWPIVLTILSALLVGCATSSIEMAPDQPDRPWPPAKSFRVRRRRPSNRPAQPMSFPPIPSLFPPIPSLPRFRLHLGSTARTYLLAELIDIAQSNNPLTRSAWNRARDVALAAGIAKSTYLPRLTAAAIGGYQLSQIAGPLGTTVTNQLHGTISLVSFDWLLFDFGQRAALVEAANQASVISNIGFTAAHQQLIYDVSSAFYSNAAARARGGNAVQSLKNAESVQAAAEDRMKRGIGTAIEVAQARQATAQARLVMVQATGAAQNAYLTLIYAMGISPLTQIKVADVSDRRLSPELAGSAEKIISVALSAPGYPGGICGSKGKPRQRSRRRG
jgi:outer membrane protein